MSRQRLYYDDSFLTNFTALVVGTDSDGTQVRLSRSAFYPASGGQPSDTGTIAGTPVTDVFEDGSGDVIHVLRSPLTARQGEEVECQIDAERRFDHMQQHTGQHLLSAVLAEMANAPTVSFHMSGEVSTIDLAVPALDAPMLEQVERRCNEIIAQNRPVHISYEDAASVRDLRKASTREGILRIVTIEGLDRSACGGTHVRATGEIGCILLQGTERIRGELRLEFVCGLRAIRRARADYQALTAIARSFSAAIDDTPVLTSSLLNKLNEAGKQRAKLAVELATLRGREAWREAAAGPDGLRVRFTEAPEITDETRAELNAFTSGGRAVALAWCASPASVLLSCSADSGLHAGNILKAAVSARGGRGGGSAQMAQGGVPSDVYELVNYLKDEIRRTGEPR